MDLLILDGNILPYHGVLVRFFDLMKTLENAPTPTIDSNGSLVPGTLEPTAAVVKRICKKPLRYVEMC